MLNITKTKENEKLTIALEGRVDTTTAPQLEEEIKSSIDGVTELVLDFEKLAYISSAGLRILLTSQKTMNKQGTMTVCHVNDIVMEILDVTGFTDVLTIQ